MISKYANHELFGNEVFAEMDRVLKEEMDLNPAMEKSASLKEPEQPKNAAFSNLVAEIVKCAEKLEEVGHPSAKKANDVLVFFSKVADFEEVQSDLENMIESKIPAIVEAAKQKVKERVAELVKNPDKLMATDSDFLLGMIRAEALRPLDKYTDYLADILDVSEEDERVIKFYDKAAELLNQQLEQDPEYKDVLSKIQQYESGVQEISRERGEGGMYEHAPMPPSSDDLAVKRLQELMR